jgi:integrative and conjugative element protein (TIGR02256 family)
MRKEVGVAWISKLSLSRMIAEADRAFPKETGGVLIGYWAVPLMEVVITDATGPGPKAIHNAYGFLPDAKYQEEEIARIYNDSGRMYTYLGDWHSHPNGGSRLSRRDRRTARAIATHAPARTPVPLMAILAAESPWTLNIWRCVPMRLGKLVWALRAIPFRQKPF